MQWIPQVLPKGGLPSQREEKNGCKLLLLIPLYFSLLTSLPATQSIYFPLSLLTLLFVFILLQTKVQIFQSVSFSFFSLSASFLAEVHLVVFGLTVSSHHPSRCLREKQSQPNKPSELTARNHEMMSSLVSCMDIPGHKTNSRTFCGYV